MIEYIIKHLTEANTQCLKCKCCLLIILKPHFISNSKRLKMIDNRQNCHQRNGTLAANSWSGTSDYSRNSEQGESCRRVDLSSLQGQG